jgi:hypothetical protein
VLSFPDCFRANETPFYPSEILKLFTFADDLMDRWIVAGIVPARGVQEIFAPNDHFPTDL